MRVLIVDDSSYICLICRQALSKAGYQAIGECYDGIQAVEKALELNPDVILMDMALPKMNGVDATKNILAQLPQVKILAMSAIHDPWMKENAIQAGCAAFLEKPFEPQQLIGYIEDILKQKKDVKYG